MNTWGGELGHSGVSRLYFGNSKLETFNRHPCGDVKSREGKGHG